MAEFVEDPKHTMTLTITQTPEPVVKFRNGLADYLAFWQGKTFSAVLQAIQ